MASMTDKVLPQLQRRHWMAGLACTLVPWSSAHAQLVDALGSNGLKGAGSTFAHPLMRAWAEAYRVTRKGGFGMRLAGGGLDDGIGGVALDYEAVGSQAGIARIRARAVDFSVTEMPLLKAELDGDALGQFPLTTGAVAVAANLGSPQNLTLRMTAPLLADVFLGRVKLWSDPAIGALNPGINLPNTPIVVVHRSDGSGTSAVFTQFLSQGSPAWKQQVGSGLLVNWPVGQGHKGNAAVARALSSTLGGVAYVNQAELASSMTIISAQNPAGRFVAPTRSSVQSAALAGSWDASSGFNTSLVNTQGDNSYPIVAVVFGLLDERSTGHRRSLTRAFFEWSLSNGRETAERLGYVALPLNVSQQILAALRA